MKSLGTQIGTSEASQPNKIQEMKERISGTEDTMKEIDTSVKGNVNFFKKKSWHKKIQEI